MQHWEGGRRAWKCCIDAVKGLGWQVGLCAQGYLAILRIQEQERYEVTLKRQTARECFDSSQNGHVSLLICRHNALQ